MLKLFLSERISLNELVDINTSKYVSKEVLLNYIHIKRSTPCFAHSFLLPLVPPSKSFAHQAEHLAKLSHRL